MFADVSIVSISFLVGLGVFTFAVVLAVVLAQTPSGGCRPRFDRCVAVARPEWRRVGESTLRLPADVEIAIPGTKSGFNARSAQLYLPPAWFAKPRPKLGVVVLLAGTPGTPEDWTHGGGADVTSDAYAAKHRGRTPVLVMADQNGSVTGDTECVGVSETYLTQDVPAFAMKRFSLSADPQAWAIGGLSEGGMCGLMVAVRNPEIYPTFIDYSGLLGPRSGLTGEEAVPCPDA